MSFSAFDPDFHVLSQGPKEPCAVLLAEMRALRTEAAAGAAVAHRLRKALLSGGSRPVSRREAEILCEIAETTAEGESDDFAGLYAAALANHLLAAGSAECAPCLDRRLWLDDAMLACVGEGEDVAALLARAVTAALCEEAPCDCAGWSARPASDAMLTDLAAAAAPGRGWLAERLLPRGGRLTRAERQLAAAMAPCCDLLCGAPEARAA